jgi:hypothetical protein
MARKNETVHQRHENHKQDQNVFSLRRTTPMETSPNEFDLLLCFEPFVLFVDETGLQR